MRIMAVDYGEKRIGVAITDPTQTIATALTVVDRDGDLGKDVEKLKEVISRYDDIQEIVFGFPRNLRGQVGPSAQHVQTFVEEFMKHTSIPVVYWDERFSTVSAAKYLEGVELSRKERRRVIDKLAATVILEDYLEHKEIQRGK